MSEPTNPNSPWRTLPTLVPTKVLDNPYDLSHIKTTKEQRDYARRRLAHIDRLRLAQKGKRNTAKLTEKS